MSYNNDEDDTIEIIYKDTPDSSKNYLSNRFTYNKYIEKDYIHPSKIKDSHQSSNKNDGLYSDVIYKENKDCINLTMIESDQCNTDKESIDNHNMSVLNTLKESIRSNFKSIKQEKEKYTHNKYTADKRQTLNSEKSTIDSKGKTEKEKLLDYYQSKFKPKYIKDLKINSRLNTSNTSNYVHSNDSDKHSQANNHYLGRGDTNVTYDNSVNIFNEYVIYNSFKNMFSRGNNKADRNQSNQSNQSNSKTNTDYKHSPNPSHIVYVHQDKNQNRDCIDKIYKYNCNNQSDKNSVTNLNQNSVNGILITENINEDTGQIFETNRLEISVLKELKEFECLEGNSSQSHNLMSTSNQRENIRNRNLCEEELNTNISKSNKISKCRRCAHLKNKLTQYKKSSLLYRKKYLKQKKSADIINLKLFYELNKNSQIGDKISSTNASTNKANEKEDEARVTSMLYDKLQGNMILFEKLENEIVNKDILLTRQDETINYQKSTINGLLQQFEIFLNQGNYLINDILLLKQSIFDKNIKDAAKDFESISQTINNYTTKIKEFTDKTKHKIEIENKQLEIVNEQKSLHKENSDCEELSFDFSKSDIDHVKKSFHVDRSLRLLDLNNTPYNDFMLTCQSNNSENYFLKEEEITDKFNH